MSLFAYLNPLYWLLAAGGLIGWTLFAAWVARDVENLRKTPELPWKIIPLATLPVLVFLLLLMPSFWLSLPVNLLVAGGVLGWYWKVRVDELGERGHLFREFTNRWRAFVDKLQHRSAASKLALGYFRLDDVPMPLPGPESPAAAGLEIMDQIILRALERHAETIELIPGRSGYDLRLMVDGVAYPQPPLARNNAEPVISTLKALAGLQLEERRRPQKGQIKVRNAAEASTILTVRTSGTTAGERLSLAANEAARWAKKVEDIGFSSEQLQAVKELAAGNQGVVVVSAPPASGTTTTLYALLRMHDPYLNTVQTIEQHPQTELEGVTVTRLEARTSDVPLSKTINSAIVKDPNVLMVADVADQTAAQMLCRYAEVEHRVYVSIANVEKAPRELSPTVAALGAWLRTVGDPQLAASTLRAVVSQRLVRVLCPRCRVPYQPDAGTLQKLNLPVGRNLQSFKANTEPLRDKDGHPMLCPGCASLGYRGRTGIFEVLIVTPEMRKAISEGNLQLVASLARRNNMMLLVEHGIRKFAAGVTSINEVLRVMAAEKNAA